MRKGFELNGIRTFAATKKQRRFAFAKLGESFSFIIMNDMTDELKIYKILNEIAAKIAESPAEDRYAGNGQGTEISLEEFVYELISALRTCFEGTVVENDSHNIGMHFPNDSSFNIEITKENSGKILL